MEDVKFVLKSLTVTLVVVFLLQIRVGGNTIEASTHEWLQNSAVTELMRGVADGGIKVSIDFYDWMRVKSGVSEAKKSSFWSFGSGDESGTHSRVKHESLKRLERTSSNVQEDSAHPKRESRGANHFRWGGGASQSSSLPEAAGSDQADSTESAD